MVEAIRMTDAPLSLLRAALSDLGVDGFIVPRTDAFQGEYIPPSDERLAWICGFTGSAGALVALRDRAALFVDGRYELQAAQQVDGSLVAVVAIRETKLTEWLEAQLRDGQVLAYDPWLHGVDEVERLEKAAAKAGASLRALEVNPIDAIWRDRPAAPSAPARPHSLAYAGEASIDKRRRLAEEMAKDDLGATLLTAPENVCWLLNIRGDDVPRTPLILSRALLHDDGRAQLFVAPDRIDAATRAHLGSGVTIEEPTSLAQALSALAGAKLGLDRSAPKAAARLAEAAGADIDWRADPVAAAKAKKNQVERNGARIAQRRDGAALSTVLAWIDREAPNGALDELTVSKKLTEIRSETAQRLGSTLEDLSFDAIVGYGPNGAIVHYRVDETSNRQIVGDGVLLIDSGGQYRDGTTDVTRTIAIGAPPAEAVRAATLVLKGMIALTELRFPPKTAGRDIEGVARAALWRAGFDFDHGVGHGVGSYLSVHEGPASLSRRSATPLEAGMILSNEPGYYRTDAFGIRIENLVLVEEPTTPDGGDRPMHAFETLTLVPIDRRLIDRAMLSPEERDWLNAYHARVVAEIGPLVDAPTRAWIESACAAI